MGFFRNLFDRKQRELDAISVIRNNLRADNFYHQQMFQILGRVESSIKDRQYSAAVPFVKQFIKLYNESEKKEIMIKVEGRDLWRTVWGDFKHHFK